MSLISCCNSKIDKISLNIFDKHLSQRLKLYSLSKIDNTINGISDVQTDFEYGVELISFLKTEGKFYLVENVCSQF